jgi:hypothetical protein
MKISDYELERCRIETLFQCTTFYVPDGFGERATTYKELAEMPFLASKLRGTTISISDFIERCAPHWEKPSLEGLLLYCEVICNIVLACDNELRYQTEAKKISKQIIENILRVTERLGYDIRKDNDGLYFVTKKDALAADVIQEIDDKAISLAILEYNRFSLRGDVTRKKELLGIVAHAVEPLIKDPSLRSKCPEVFDDIKFGLNNLNIRHNNVEGANLKSALLSISDANLEKLYDSLFSSLLILLRIAQNQKGHEAMDKMKKSMKQ